MRDQDLDTCDCPTCVARVGLYVPTRVGLVLIAGGPLFRPDTVERMRDQIANGQDIDEEDE